MQLHCLGTAGYHPSESRHTSCYLLPQSGIVLDAGTGMFRLPERIETDSLDIVLSHAHLDHIAGLTFLLDILYQRPVDEVRVWGQADKLEAVRTHLTSELIFPVELPVRWCALEDQTTIELPDCSLSWRPQNHPGGSVAYRMDWSDGRSLVYATDSDGEHDADSLEWMSHADVLLHECNFQDHQKEWAIKTGHCYLGKVAEVSRAVKPKRLLLTHINPIEELVLDPNDRRFEMPVEIVSDGLVVDF
ncbi:MBL fold metallo-hydrolase [Neorhodopirellula pilleata]|uniref:Ribonuclease Z n=1 Tax=Neorhodopirellula pilleata TaxID=2714738 RepID=A0A5C6ARA1_9BACT|nr:MBL fold metallo-hydrolase [Neorhodopirellula pilleata]TWU01759.1 ribonuclease Z [Neorhodopirellula pilleata]